MQKWQLNLELPCCKWRVRFVTQCNQCNSLGGSSSFRFKQAWSTFDGHFVMASPCFGIIPESCSFVTDRLICAFPVSFDEQIDCLISSIETGVARLPSVNKLPITVSFIGTNRSVRSASSKLLKTLRDDAWTWKSPFVKFSDSLVTLKK